MNVFLQNLGKESTDYQNCVSNIERYKNPHVWERLKFKLFEDSRYSDAVELCKIYVTENEKSSKSYLLLARAYEMLRKNELALKTYKSGIAQCANSKAELYCSYANLAQKHYNKSQVIKIYKQAVKHSYLATLINYINYLLSIEEPQLAENVALDALENYKQKNTQLMSLLVDSYIKQEKFLEAKETLSKQLSKSPRNIDILIKLNEVNTHIN